MSGRDKRFAIKGKIITEYGNPIPHLLVQAYHQRYNPDFHLGQGITNQAGVFTIRFFASDFEGVKENRGPDIILEIFLDAIRLKPMPPLTIRRNSEVLTIFNEITIPKNQIISRIPSNLARIFLDSLYIELSDGTGAQQEYQIPGYIPKIDIPDGIEFKNYLAYQAVSKMKRVWTYTQGIALSRAVKENESEKAREIAFWLMKNAVDVEGPSGNDMKGGWHFSYDLEGWGYSYERNEWEPPWRDVRLVTGANAWALHGLGEYIRSPQFAMLPSNNQMDLKNSYKSILMGLLEHRRSDNLFSAGWDDRQLIDLRGVEYYEKLNEIGENLTQIQRFKNQKVVIMEHNIDMLNVLNFLVKNPSDFNLDRGINYREIRDKLHQAIFTLLFNPNEKRFITGRSGEAGRDRPSIHSAIDNASWLALYVDYDVVVAEEIEKLASALEFTINHFIKDNLVFQGNTYYGAHYFLNPYEDPYIERSDRQEAIYHMEATAGLILGLKKFVSRNETHPNARNFTEVAEKLWSEMQRFAKNHEFLYATEHLPYLMVPLYSSTSAIWYLDVYDEYK